MSREEMIQFNNECCGVVRIDSAVEIHKIDEQDFSKNLARKIL
jgi:hypothetical protein